MRAENHLILTAVMVAASLAAGGLSPAGPELPSATTSKTGHEAHGKRPGSLSNRSSGDSAATRVEEARALRNKLTASDLRASILVFEDAARSFQITGRSLDAAHAEREAGDTYLMMSRYGAALSAYRRALIYAGKDPEARSRILSHIARMYATKGDVAQAKQYADQALALCSANSAPGTRADALEALGETHSWSGDYPGAVEPFRQARDLYIESADYDGQNLALVMLAYARSAADRDEGIRLAGDALELSHAHGDVYGVAKARLALGYFAMAAGQFERAQCNCGEAYKVFHVMGDKDNEAIAMNISGQVARETGDAQLSYNNYRLARAAFASIHDQLGEAEAITGMGAALTALRRYQELLPLYSDKLQLAQRIENHALKASALLNMADVYQLQHHYSRADSAYRQALAIYRSIQQTYGEGDALTRLAGLEVAQGDGERAISSLEKALGLRQKNGQTEEIAKIQYELARIYYRSRHFDRALERIGETIKIIESQRVSIAKFDSRAQYFAAVHQYYALLIEILMRLHDLHPDQGYSRRAFEASEKSKVRSLLDLLSSSTETSPCQEMLRIGGDSSSAQSTLPDRDPGESTLPGTLSLEQVQTIIGGDGVLVEYALGDDTSYVWLVDQKTIVSYALPSSKRIQALASSFRDDLMPLPQRKDETFLEYDRRAGGVAAVRRARARELSQILLGKLNIENGKRILIVPDGALQYVPFSALPLPSAGSEETVLEQHDVAYLPSASALAALRAAAARRPPPTADVAILADPVFTTGTARPAPGPGARGAESSEHPSALRSALADTQNSQRIARLPGSRKEALAIQQILGPDHALLALGFDANRDFVLHGPAASFRVLHFATHGIIDTRRPEMSGLILSLVNPQGQRQDGYLRLGDIYRLKLSADLVVLSSCQSALGKGVGSEGIIGLPRGFLYAGARSVIASLWKVDDEATAALMTELYTRMHRGESPNTALRGAQLALAKDPHYSKPYYWAAFLLEGDYK